MEIQEQIQGKTLEDIPLESLRAFKEAALSDRRLAYLTRRTEDEVRAMGLAAAGGMGIKPGERVRLWIERINAAHVNTPFDFEFAEPARSPE